jgi:uncharacterized paraquat-inducible protein A
MPTIVFCPGCNLKTLIPDEFAGRNVTCPKCSHTFLAPGDAPAPPPAPTPGAGTGAADSEREHAGSRGKRGKKRGRGARGGTSAPSGRFTCPFCRSQQLPRVEQRLSQAGVIVMVALIVCCFPLFWIPLVSMKEDQHRCADCGLKLG